jgi:hypothetical protein
MTAMSRGRWAFLCCAGALAAMAAACSGGDTIADPIGEPVAAEAGDEVSWLASQTSDSGRIEFTDGRATQLVMEGVDPHTIMFSDRPDRLADVVDTGGFSDQWDEMFAGSAPNAVLVEHRPSGTTDSLVVILSRPVFDGATRTLSYDIEVLADEQLPESVDGLTGAVHDEVPREFRSASLFIDDAVCYESKQPYCPPPPEELPPPRPDVALPPPVVPPR